MPLPAYEIPKTTPIYSFAALKTKQKEIKDRATEEVVHITENGNAAFVFCSEEILAQEKAKAVEEALYERSVMEVLERGEKDITAGRVYRGVAAARAEVEKRLDRG